MLVFNSVKGEKVAPGGTVTTKLVLVAELTVARVAPKNTILLAGVGLNNDPVMVTILPTAALVGVKEVIVGINLG
jgi:hypothetical protein